MKVKLCGFTDLESVKTAISLKCDFLGFVFCPKSVRKITPENAAKISADVPASISKVAVVVDPSLDLLNEIYQTLSPDFFQFHGAETPEFLKEIRKKFPRAKIIKGFGISDRADLEQIKNYEEVADFFLLDGRKAGSGEKFDWQILQDFNSKKDWFLAGGLNSENLCEAVKITGAKMVDVSSGIEKIRGQKSSELIKEFMKKAKLCS